jgi:hypothetical protein
LKEPNLLAEAGQGLLGAGLSYLRGDISGVLKTGQSLFKKLTAGQGATEKARRTKTSPADVIQFSGCKDNQTSADAYEQVLLSVYIVGLIRLGTSDGSYELGVQRMFIETAATELSSVVGEYQGVVGGQVSTEAGVECESPYRYEFVVYHLVVGMDCR